MIITPDLSPGPFISGQRLYDKHGPYARVRAGRYPLFYVTCLTYLTSKAKFIDYASSDPIFSSGGSINPLVFLIALHCPKQGRRDVVYGPP